MKKTLQWWLIIACIFKGFSQTPKIDGDTMLCPNENGTVSIITNQTYDSYQWYYKYWFLSTDYQAIDGATSNSFNYDWNTYDQALFKVVVTLNDISYESNVIQIDSYQWSALSVSFNLGENAIFDPVSESIVLCQGTSYEIAINNPPYDNITWYRNGVPIDGATGFSYSVNQEGVYQVSAAPSFCPNTISNSAIFNTIIDSNCTLETEELEKSNVVEVYPNPVKNELNLSLSTNSFKYYKIIDLKGKVIVSGKIQALTNKISLSSLNKGLYLLKLLGDNMSLTKKLLKQ